MKNNIITSAYIQGTTLSFSVYDEENNKGTFTWVNLNYGVDVQMDRSEHIETPNNSFLYPNTILAYRRKDSKNLEELTKNGVFSSSILPEDFLNSYIDILKNKGAIELPTIYGGKDAENLLVQKGIRTIVK